MAEIKIDSYRGFNLYYDEDENVFYSDLQNKWDLKKEPTRASLKDLKTVIDGHIKANASFSPFMALYAPLAWRSKDKQQRIPGASPEPIKILSVRKNGGLVVRKNKATKDEQLNPSSYSDDRQGLFEMNDHNKSLIKEMDQLITERKKLEKRMNDCLEKFQPLDLQFIDQFTVSDK